MTTKEIIQSQIKSILEDSFNSIDIVIDNQNISGQQTITKQTRVLDQFGEGDSYEFSIIVNSCHSPRIQNNKKVFINGTQYKIVIFETNDYSILLHLSK